MTWWPWSTFPNEYHTASQAKYPTAAATRPQRHQRHVSPAATSATTVAKCSGSATAAAAPRLSHAVTHSGA